MLSAIAIDTDKTENRIVEKKWNEMKWNCYFISISHILIFCPPYWLNWFCTSSRWFYFFQIRYPGAIIWYLINLMVIPANCCPIILMLTEPWVGGAAEIITVIRCIFTQELHWRTRWLAMSSTTIADSTSSHHQDDVKWHIRCTAGILLLDRFMPLFTAVLYQACRGYAVLGPSRTQSGLRPCKWFILQQYLHGIL